MRRYADKRDENEPKIIKYLQRCGCKVAQISQRGFPDLVVGYGPHNILLEVKAPAGRLTPDQDRFFKRWEGCQVDMVQSIADVKKVLKQFMTIRIYECEECGQFERKESIKSDPLTICPTCDKLVIQKYSAPLIVFRGNGWANKKDTNAAKTT